MYVPSIRTTAILCLLLFEISAPSFLAILSASATVSKLGPLDVGTEDSELLSSGRAETPLVKEHLEGV